VKIISRFWTGVQDLGALRGFLVAVLTAVVVWLIIIAVGPLAIVLAAPSGLFFLVFFGAAFVSAVRRSRFLPGSQVVQFVLPIICGLALSVGSGILGIRVAHFLNDSVFHMSDSFVR